MYYPTLTGTFPKKITSYVHANKSHIKKGCFSKQRNHLTGLLLIASNKQNVLCTLRVNPFYLQKNRKENNSTNREVDLSTLFFILFL